MAITNELGLVQPSCSIANITVGHEQHYNLQQPWLPSISSRNPRNSAPVQAQRLHPLLPSPGQAPNKDHESRVQWFACQLSKKTLRQYLSFIPVPLPLPTSGTRIELLPQDIIDQICRYLPYETLLWLHQQSKALHRAIDPHLAADDTKLSFVLRAERDFKKHYALPSRNLGCYMCYRVLPASVFASNQALQARLRTPASDEQPLVNLRRFCIYCGIRSGCHNAGDELNTRTGGRFWLCDCLNIISDKTASCESCRTLCPLVPRGPREAAAVRKLRGGGWNVMDSRRISPIS
ncbi:hypothetical protein F5Y13DRAFT_189627 [Hypoxylon sp. FL1857]|nr:hypothetical protein F5Y13DRAFT_189627 [Hypoxylon sp. FL1857]